MLVRFQNELGKAAQKVQATFQSQIQGEMQRMLSGLQGNQT